MPKVYSRFNSQLLLIGLLQFLFVVRVYRFPFYNPGLLKLGLKVRTKVGYALCDICQNFPSLRPVLRLYQISKVTE